MCVCEDVRILNQQNLSVINRNFFFYENNNYRIYFNYYSRVNGPCSFFDSGHPERYAGSTIRCM